MKGELLFLGTGGSMGIPMIGCKCTVCLSDQPFNNRLRSSALISVNNKQFLIDCGPDFRQQALRYKIDDIDGLLLTHAHYDHIAGIDELRAYFIETQKPLHCLLSSETAKEVEERFSYIFSKHHKGSTVVSKIILELLPEREGDIEFQGLPLSYVTYIQGGMLVNGFKLGNLAYISDIHHFDENIFNLLKGTKHLIISALRLTPSPSHLSVEEAIDFANKVGAEHTWLTHIAHELDHEATNQLLPANVRMAYDGLALTFEM